MGFANALSLESDDAAERGHSLGYDSIFRVTETGGERLGSPKRFVFDLFGRRAFNLDGLRISRDSMYE